MSSYIERIHYFGEPAIKAGNEHLEIVLVPGWGSNLISLVHKESNRDILRSPKTSEEFWANPILFGDPILFPPNRIGDGTFTFHDCTYHLDINEKDNNNHIHGLLHHEKWELVRAEAVENEVILETKITSSQSPSICRQFPHHFSVQMSYRLKDSKLYKNATIINHGQEPFPWGLGYHTSFLFSEATSSFALTADKRWKLNERLLPTGELEDIEYRDQLKQGMSLKGFRLDDVFLSAVSTGGKNEVSITYRDNKRENGLRIVYRADENFKNWVVYNADGKQGFVCPEPYTWVTNAPNLNLPASLTGLQVLSPGEQVTLKAELEAFVNEVPSPISTL